MVLENFNSFLFFFLTDWFNLNISIQKVFVKEYFSIVPVFLFNEIIIFQLILLLILTFFLSITNVFSAWLLSSLYLINVGIILLLNDVDIFVGFLWLVDFGVGIVFLIFLSFFFAFTIQKIDFLVKSRYFIYSIICFIFVIIISTLFTLTIDVNFFLYITIWFYFISYYDYYNFFFFIIATDLFFLHEIYFLINSWEFVLINLFLFIGILCSICLIFLIRYMFYLIFPQLIYNFNLLSYTHSELFFRSQDIILQKFIFTSTHVWSKLI